MPISESQKIEVIEKTNNHCCICQTPFIHIHHIDENRENNSFDNLAPLCPNCHSLAHSESNMYNNLSPERIKIIRDNWYAYCEHRRENLGNANNIINLGPAKLKIKNFDRSIGGYGPTHGWLKTFISLDPNYKTLTKDEIIDRVFSTSNRDDLKTHLDTVKNMYGVALRNSDNQQRFREVCNSFGFDYDGQTVL